MLSFVQINPSSEKIIASVIWLHGLGANGHDFVPFVEQMGLAEQGVRFIFPHAPSMPVTVNGGMSMPAWYDILTADFFSAEEGKSAEDQEGIRYSQAQVEQLIQNEAANGLSTERIFLAGFSQGGAIALHTGLRYPERLGGIIALSTYLPLVDALSDEAAEVNQCLPVLMMHGQCDEIIPCQAAMASKDRLIEAGYPVDWHDFSIAHAVCQQQLKIISDWVLQRLSPLKTM